MFHFPTDAQARRSSYVTIHNQINQADQNYQLSIANGLWAQKDYKFLDEYLAVLQQFYAGEARNADFINSAETERQRINKWVAEKTHDRIKGLFPPGSLNELTRLVLANAIYFKGTWIKQFDQDQTKDEDFHVNATDTVKVPMMRRSDEEAVFNYAETGELQMLEMSYEGGKLSMLVMLPKDGQLASLESLLSATKINEWKSGLRQQRVNVFMPKFTFDTKYFMNGALKNMGMPTAFTEKADFSGMDGKKDLLIQTVIHQAFINVDEEGTEAAAATGVGVGATAGRIGPIPTFRADHSFIFIIQENENGNILFLGRVNNPVSKNNRDA